MDQLFRARQLITSKMCNPLYANYTYEFRSEDFRSRDLLRAILRKYTRNQDVLDLGCGKHGGLSDLILESEAHSYTGVDIHEESISKAQQRFPEGKFICIDPVEKLASLPLFHVIISSGLFDREILFDQSYAQLLIKSIAHATPSGQHTLHYGREMRYNSFRDSFLLEGFEDLNEGNDYFIVLRKR